MAVKGIPPRAPPSVPSEAYSPHGVSLGPTPSPSTASRRPTSPTPQPGSWEVAAAAELHTRLVLALESGISDIVRQLAAAAGDCCEVSPSLGMGCFGAATRGCSWHVGFYSNAQLIGNLFHMAVQLALFPKPCASDASTYTDGGLLLESVAADTSMSSTRLASSPFEDSALPLHGSDWSRENGSIVVRVGGGYKVVQADVSTDIMSRTLASPRRSPTPPSPGRSESARRTNRSSSPGRAAYTFTHVHSTSSIENYSMGRYRTPGDSDHSGTPASPGRQAASQERRNRDGGDRRAASAAERTPSQVQYYRVMKSGASTTTFRETRAAPQGRTPRSPTSSRTSLVGGDEAPREGVSPRQRTRGAAGTGGRTAGPPPKTRGTL